MEELIDYNQFRKSKLQEVIMNVIKCSYTDAFQIGKTHCNLLSTWAIIKDLKVYEHTYYTFYRECLIENICNKEGFLYLDKPEIFKKLNLNIEIKKYDSIPDDLDFNQRFQIAINNKHHFMSGKSLEDNKSIMLYDTNDRPFGEELLTALKETDKITWIKKYSIKN